MLHYLTLRSPSVWEADAIAPEPENLTVVEALAACGLLAERVSGGHASEDR